MAIAMSQSSPLPPHIHHPQHPHQHQPDIAPSSATSAVTVTSPLDPPQPSSSSFQRHTSSSSVNASAPPRNTPVPGAGGGKGKERQQLDGRPGEAEGEVGQGEDVDMDDGDGDGGSGVNANPTPSVVDDGAGREEIPGQGDDAMQVDSSPPAPSSQPQPQIPSNTSNSTSANTTSTTIKSPTPAAASTEAFKSPSRSETVKPTEGIKSPTSARTGSGERTSSTAEALKGALLSSGGGGGIKSPERSRASTRMGSISGPPTSATTSGAGGGTGEGVVMDRRSSAAVPRRPSASHSTSSTGNQHIPSSTRSRERSTSSGNVLDKPPRNLNTAPAPGAGSSTQPSYPQSSNPTPHPAQENPPAPNPAPASAPAPAPGPGRMNLVTYPTLELIRLMASLLNQIAQANDRIRREMAVSAGGGVGAGAVGSRRESGSLEGVGGGKKEEGRAGAGSPERRTSASTAAGTGKTIAAGMVIPPFRPKNSHDGGKKSDATAAVGQDGGKSSHAVVMADSPVHKSVHQTPTSPASTPPESGQGQGQGQGDAPREGVEAGAGVEGKSQESGEPPKQETTTEPATANPQSLSRSSSSAGVSQMQGAPLAAPPWPTTSAARHAVIHPASLLCFHARNVPSIGIEAYLQRILKYCPVTNEVFLSLLVYFDRMSKKLIATANGLAGAGLPQGAPTAGSAGGGGGMGATEMDMERQKGFAIDSYNMHRLVIAGITVSSKFHSDVFYTNSRYAKVGGLPQTELNQLELQFLLLNDFGLMIKVEEMQRYADSLLLYGQNPAASVSAALAATQQRSHQG